MFHGQIERSLSLNIVIRIKGNNYFTRISYVESVYREQIFLLRQIDDIDACALIFDTNKNFDCKRNLSRFCNVAVFETMKPKNFVPPPGGFGPADAYCRKRWRRAQHIVNEFWARWCKEFI